MKRIVIALGVCAIFAVGAVAGNGQGPASTAKHGTMAAHEKLIDLYFDSLNETDNSRRRELLRRIWVSDGTFVSPVGKAVGYGAIDAQIKEFQERSPDTKVRRTSDIEILHDNYIRFRFEAVRPGVGLL